MYKWKLDELGWGAFVAVIVYILSELVLFDPTSVTDWHVWAIALASGSIRAAAGALLALIRPTE